MRKGLFLTALAIILLGLVGTSLSTYYEQVEFIPSQNQPWGAVKVSYGFPLLWHGYSGLLSPLPGAIGNREYWLSLESLVLDSLFWFAISFCVCISTMISVKILLKTTASKTVVTYFLASASFSVVGLSLFFFSYEDLGLRLYAIGIFLVAATYYQSVVEERKT
jgi:hypothetical protein